MFMHKPALLAAAEAVKRVGGKFAKQTMEVSQGDAPTVSATVIWEPQPGPQTALIKCPVFEVFFGGARGGGKTEASIGDWLDHSATYGEDAIGIFFRRKLVQLREVIARTRQIFPKLGAKYSVNEKTWTMANGARLIFAYLENDADAEEYQGHSYTRVYIEEVTNFPSPDPINKLRATLRSGAGVPCGMRLTGNPGGPGHLWVKARYIDPCKEGYKVLTESCEMEDPDTGEMMTVSLDRVFIPSKLTDNKLLIRNQPTYVLQLRMSGSAALVKAWLDGDWDIVDGAYFSEYHPSVHVLKESEWLHKIPKHAMRFRSMDWGSAVPFSVGWYAISDGTWGLPKGALLKYREWYGWNGKANTGLKMDSPLVARGIKDREAGERISYGVAGHDIFIRNGGPSIMENMAICGIMWRKADNKRLPGWEQLHCRLKGTTDDEGNVVAPMLYFLDCCADGILRTLPVLQHDDNNPEDVSAKSEDHAAEETRYAVMSRPWIPKPKPLPGNGLPKLPGQMTINELIARNKRLNQGK